MFKLKKKQTIIYGVWENSKYLGAGTLDSSALKKLKKEGKTISILFQKEN